MQNGMQWIYMDPTLELSFHVIHVDAHVLHSGLQHLGIGMEYLKKMSSGNKYCSICPVRSVLLKYTMSVKT